MIGADFLSFSTAGRVDLLGESGPRPATIEQIDALPVIKVNVDRYKEEKNTNDAPSCVVCYEDFEHDSEAIEFPRCKHMYHSICIKEWLSRNNSCPMCRIELPAVEESGNSGEELAAGPDRALPQATPGTGSSGSSRESPPIRMADMAPASRMSLPTRRSSSQLVGRLPSVVPLPPFSLPPFSTILELVPGTSQRREREGADETGEQRARPRRRL
mmetsp:Transcript_64/g.111  ORF Transcript_64/g.111 Transcript_64/m.111 type:complete len:215 (-) Transcript_64:1133-1777(-)